MPAVKRNLFASMVLTATLLASGNASAVVTITLDPSVDKVHRLENVFVDINVSGLQSGGVNALLGAFDLGLLYEASLFTPLLVPPAGFGPDLGDVFLGEAVSGIDTSTPGLVNLFEVSLLTTPELAALQGDSFRLATIGFFANGTASGPTTTFQTANILLSDDLGNRITPVVSPAVSIKVPEPAPLALLLAGATVGFAARRRRATGDRGHVSSPRPASRT